MPLIRKPAPQTPQAALPAGEMLSRLGSGTEEERWTAARAAAGAPGGTEALARALGDESAPRVREAIFTSLARIGSEESVRAVAVHLASDDVAMRTGALDALRAMPQAAGPHLPELLRSPDPDVRLLVCDLVRILPPAEATRVLCALLETEREANVCAAAVETLAETGLPEAVPALRRCAARFADAPFLGFSIDIAIERIGAQAGAPRD